MLKFRDEKLGLLPGIPVSITKKEAANNDITNGLMGDIIGIQLSTDIKFESAIIHEDETHIASNLPGIVFVDVPTAVFAKTFKKTPSYYPRTTVPLPAVSDVTPQIKRGPHIVM